MNGVELDSSYIGAICHCIRYVANNDWIMANNDWIMVNSEIQIIISVRH